MIDKESDHGALSAKRAETKKEIREVSDLWEFMTFEEQRLFLQKVINRITVTSNSILIDYNF